MGLSWEVRYWTLDEAVEDFGKPTEVFQPDRTNQVAGVISGIALILGGIGYALHFLFGEPPNPRGDETIRQSVGLTLCFIAFAVGVGVLCWVMRHFSFRALVCPKGLVFASRGRIETCAWDEMEKVLELAYSEFFPLTIRLESLLPKTRNYTVVRKDGVRFKLTLNSVKNVSRLATTIREAAATRSIPWVVEEQ